MTTSTAPATWPTEERLALVEQPFNEAFNQTEFLTLELHQILRRYMDEGIWPYPLPTTATVGALYSLVETLRSEDRALSGLADALERDLRDVDGLRRDAIHIARSRADG